MDALRKVEGDAFVFRTDSVYFAGIWEEILIGDPPF